MYKKILVVFVFGLFLFAGIASAGVSRVSMCHMTGSAKNPVVMIAVSPSAVQSHLNKGDTLLPVGALDCSDGGGDPVLQ